jgi:hypothetical protein
MTKKIKAIDMYIKQGMEHAVHWISDDDRWIIRDGTKGDVGSSQERQLAHRCKDDAKFGYSVWPDDNYECSNCETPAPVQVRALHAIMRYPDRQRGAE